uniref:Uncharacterized protein n=1 Tax=Malurus cyaneus samueli TaxID=2593467 RepID=A0A8C5THA9_9PASS
LSSINPVPFALLEAIFNPGINYLDPSTSAFPNSIWHSSTRWVNHRHQSYKAEFVYREVQVICIKLEAFRELIIRQSQVAESCNTSKPTFALFLHIRR